MRRNSVRRAQDDRLNRRFTRRALLMICVQTAVTAGLGARMYQLQVIDSERYNRLSDRNRIRPRLIPPTRGEITDRRGQLLAQNRQNYRVLLVAEQTDDPASALERISRLIDLPETKRESLLEEIEGKPVFTPVEVAENLSWDEFARINANAPALPGVNPDLGWTRHYPHGFETAHVVGYVGKFSERDKNREDAQDEAFEHPGMRIGKSGIERAHEAMLRGAAGRRRVEVNALGRELRELHRYEGEPGAPMSLTLDLKLQRYALERFGPETGAAVVMDVMSGDILAMASAPSFDPNPFILGISTTDWAALRDHPEVPMLNRAVSGEYPPGSTFKMMVGLAGLESGAINRSFSVFCPGYTQLGNRQFHCWKRGGHGRMNLHNALKHSCDVYFYEVARKVGIDALAEHANAFGLGLRPEMDFPAMRKGIMPNKTWKLATQDEAWQVGDTLNAGIGQGYVLTSPLQLAVMTARIANGGLKVHPRLVRTVRGEAVSDPPLERIRLRDSTLAAIKAGMNAVVNETGGTARRARIALPESQMAGKTGTAQVRIIRRAERESGVRSNEELARRLRDHALFVAYAPVDRPRLSIAVIVEHGGSGSGAAAPVARDILLHALYDGDPPEEATAGVVGLDGRPVPT